MANCAEKWARRSFPSENFSYVWHASLHVKKPMTIQLTHDLRLSRARWSQWTWRQVTCCINPTNGYTHEGTWFHLFIHGPKVNECVSGVNFHGGTHPSWVHLSSKPLPGWWGWAFNWKEGRLSWAYLMLRELLSRTRLAIFVRMQNVMEW